MSNRSPPRMSLMARSACRICSTAARTATVIASSSGASAASWGCASRACSAVITAWVRSRTTVSCSSVTTRRRWRSMLSR